MNADLEVNRESSRSKWSAVSNAYQWFKEETFEFTTKFGNLDVTGDLHKGKF